MMNCHCPLCGKKINPPHRKNFATWYGSPRNANCPHCNGLLRIARPRLVKASAFTSFAMLPITAGALFAADAKLIHAYTFIGIFFGGGLVTAVLAWTMILTFRYVPVSNERK